MEVKWSVKAAFSPLQHISTTKMPMLEATGSLAHGNVKPINHASHLRFIINMSSKILKGKCLLFDLQGVGYS